MWKADTSKVVTPALRTDGLAPASKY
jgi:hypothetical protein